ncbi:MAG: hypothetical protein ACE5FI_01865 [Anaerolineales bacterium]
MATDLARVTRHVTGDFFTPTFRITGRVGVGNSGLVGLLNDATYSILTFHDVYLSRILEPGKIVAHYEIAYMAKSAFEMAVLQKREDLGPAAALRGGYARVQEHAVMVATDTFEITGTIEQPGRFEAEAILSPGAGVTIGVYEATAMATDRPEVTYSGGGVLVNRNSITVVCNKEA